VITDKININNLSEDILSDVFVGIGSNLENPSLQVKEAFKELSLLRNTKCHAVSSLYKSKPMGPQNQPDYMNAAAWLKTSLAPEHFLNELQNIEDHHCRDHDNEHWGPRTLDLDIIVFSDITMSNNRLTIPHPLAHERGFVLRPLHEIKPDLYIPNQGYVRELLQNCKYNSVEKVT